MNIFRMYRYVNKVQVLFPYVIIVIFFLLLLAGLGVKLQNESCEEFCTEKNAVTVIKDNQAREKERHHRVWIRSKRIKNKHLKHVVTGFKGFNYEILDFGDVQTPEHDWNVLWSHSYPFNKLKQYLLSLKTVRCINHYPGTGFITNKVSLAASGISAIPKAFRIPEEKAQLFEFAKEVPNALFVQKSNDHRGIKIERINSLQLKESGSFVQQFIHNPLLIDGYKFDIGIYTAITSVNPLRVYIFQDVLFRYCQERYYPFDANNSKKYVVGDDYRPTWKVPSLKHYYEVQKLGMKGSFNAWLNAQNKNPTTVWKAVEESIREVFYANEDNIITYSNNYPPNLKFFEVMRFDFIITEDLTVYLMEANMSPNLSSAHFKENELLYNQVVFNLLSLVGLSYNFCSPSVSKEEDDMRCSSKDISVFSDHCSTHCMERSDCADTQCQLCHPCLSGDMTNILRKAFLEHTFRGSYRRIVPKPITTPNTPANSEDLSPRNTLMGEWFRGKCLVDKTFCS